MSHIIDVTVLVIMAMAIHAVEYRPYLTSIIEILIKNDIEYIITQNDQGVNPSESVATKSGTVIVVTKINEWGGPLPTRGPIIENGAEVGYASNNIRRDKEPGDALICQITYGQLPEAIKEAIVKIVRGL